MEAHIPATQSFDPLEREQYHHPMTRGHGEDDPASELDLQHLSMQIPEPQKSHRSAILADQAGWQNRFRPVIHPESSPAHSPRVWPSEPTKATESCPSAGRFTKLPHAIRVETTLLSSLPRHLRQANGNEPAVLLSIRESCDQVVQHVIKDWDQLKDFDVWVRTNFFYSKHKQNRFARIPPRHICIPERGRIVPTQVDTRHDMLGAYFRAVLELGASFSQPAKRSRFLHGLNEFISTDLVTLSPFVASGGLAAFFLRRSLSSGVWYTSYITLNATVLDVFDRPDGKILGSFRLTPSCWIHINYSDDDGTADDERYSFSVISETGDELKVSAETRKDMLKWVTAILNVIERGVTGSAYTGGYLSTTERSQRNPPSPLPYMVAREFTACSPGRIMQREKTNISISGPSMPMQVPTTPTAHPLDDVLAAPLSLPLVSELSSGQLSSLVSAESPSSSMTRSSSTGMSVTSREPIFGVSLNKLTRMRSYHGVAVPTVVARCLDYLEKEQASHEEGIFRTSAQKSLLTHLEHEFDLKGDFNFRELPDMTTDTAATLLKQYLRRLPNPLLGDWTRVQEAQVTQLDETQLTSLLRSRIDQLTTYEYNLLYVVTEYLQTVTIDQQSLKRRMDARNLSIIFSATLHLPQIVVYTLITQFDKAFIPRLSTAPLIPLDVLPRSVVLARGQSLLT